MATERQTNLESLLRSEIGFRKREAEEGAKDADARVRYLSEIRGEDTTGLESEAAKKHSLLFEEIMAHEELIPTILDFIGISGFGDISSEAIRAVAESLESPALVAPEHPFLEDHPNLATIFTDPQYRIGGLIARHAARDFLVRSGEMYFDDSDPYERNNRQMASMKYFRAWIAYSGEEIAEYYRGRTALLTERQMLLYLQFIDNPPKNADLPTYFVLQHSSSSLDDEVEI